MCGIVGRVSGQSVTEDLMDGLSILEYRGYDSAGLAVARNATLITRKAAGPLDSLRAVLKDAPLMGRVGIGHTRWATHGKPSEANAHPHTARGIAVVHNGIIENHAALRAELAERGAVFHSETDSEVLPWMIAEELERTGVPMLAMRAVVARLEGHFAIAALFADHPGVLMVTRRDCPLVIGIEDEGKWIASDPLAYADRAQRVVFLEDDDVAELRRLDLRIIDRSGQPVHRPSRDLTATLSLSNSRLAAASPKDGHHMHREIHEQPDAVARTLAGMRLQDTPQTAGTAAQQTHGVAGLSTAFLHAQALDMVACGTSLYAAMIGREWMEDMANLPSHTEIASEYRCRPKAQWPGKTALFVSQSGETADSLAAMRACARDGIPTAAIVNVAGSAMDREADCSLRTQAGPEIGVASTKAFTAQLAALLVASLSMGRIRGVLDPDRAAHVERVLARLPSLMATALDCEGRAAEIGAEISQARSALYLGRGTGHPLAMEGALKLKEITYIHAEGLATGELKHGPLALVDETVPVIASVPSGPLLDKTLSGLREVTARGGRVIALTDANAANEVGQITDQRIVLPACAPEAVPFVHAIPMQLIAYHAAVAKGTNVDKPRNLAKSVTVE